jgi:hypothetical protein
VRTHRGSRAVTGARPFHSHDASPSPDNNSTIPTTRRTTVALRRRKKKLADEMRPDECHGRDASKCSAHADRRRAIPRDCKTAPNAADFPAFRPQHTISAETIDAFSQHSAIAAVAERQQRVDAPFASRRTRIGAIRRVFSASKNQRSPTDGTVFPPRIPRRESLHHPRARRRTRTLYAFRSARAHGRVFPTLAFGSAHPLSTAIWRKFLWPCTTCEYNSGSS